MTVNEPPQGFRPTEASDAELQEWGFPPRPTNSSGLEEWRELVGSYKEPFVGAGCEGTERSRQYLGENLESENWSGQMAVNPGNPNKWHAVVGTFYNASDHGSCSPSAAVASWVGLGGWYTNRFMQTGTELRASGRLEPWIEIYAGNYNFAYEIPNFPIAPTNYIRLYAGYNRSLEIAYFYITNDATGQTVLTEWHIGPQFYDGSSAEWIDEAPYSGSSELPLLNFGEITWWSNTAQNENNEVLPVASLVYVKVAPWHGNHRTSWPGSVWNGSNWTDFYYTCK